MKILNAVLFLVVMVCAAYAKEGGDQSPIGAASWLAGDAPPPGFYYINYLGYYSGQLRNGSGGKAIFDGATPSANAVGNGFRFLNITRYKILGATWGFDVDIPIIDQSVNLGGRASKFGVGDILLDPLILAWHRPAWHVLTGIDVFVPAGYFDQHDPRVSIGAHYYSVEPIVGYTYLPKSGWEASARLAYNLKTRNPATQYHSGQDVHMDYLAGKHLKGWMLGGAGYFLEQTTGDTVNGQTVAAASGLYDAGRRGQVVAIGPSGGYTTQRHLSFILQWQHETLVRNRFGGDKFWFKLVLPLTAIFGGAKP